MKRSHPKYIDKKEDILHITCFYVTKRSADGTLEALMEADTKHGNILVTCPWRIYRKAPNAKETAENAWDDAEEQYRYQEESKRGWFAWLDLCLGVGY